MWYFAYGSNLNIPRRRRMVRHYGHRCPRLKPGRPAVLDNYRLCFPIFSEYWAGGSRHRLRSGKVRGRRLFDLTDAEIRCWTKVDRG